MAMMSTPSAAPSAPPPMSDAAAPADDFGAVAEGAEEPGSEDVLLTVCKEPDGSYSLIKGDEQDADGADTAGSATESDKQTFDNIGALLKAIMDLLQADERADGAEGGDQFQAGFDENTAKPASPIPQKF